MLTLTSTIDPASLDYLSEPEPLVCVQCGSEVPWSWWVDRRRRRLPSHWRRPAATQLSVPADDKSRRIVWRLLCPGCQARALAEEQSREHSIRLHRAGIPDRYWRWRYVGEGFLVEDMAEGLLALDLIERGDDEACVLRHDGNEDAWADCARAARGEPVSVVLEGGVGTGKTLMLSAVAVCLLEVPLTIRTTLDADGYRMASRTGGVAVVYTSEGELLADVARRRSRIGGDAERYTLSLTERAQAAQVLVLDELGSSTGKAADDWRALVVEGIVDARYRAGRPILAATNCSALDLESRLGQRTVSRLREMACWHVVSAPPGAHTDWRAAIQDRERRGGRET